MRILLLFLIITFMGMRTVNNGIKGEVVCFGDSITHGAHVNGRSWVYFLSAEHPDVNFIKAGHNGRKTSDRAELMPVLRKYPHADYFLIFLGVNDLKNGNDSLVENCVENVKWMIDKIRESDESTKIVLLAPSDINLKTMSVLNVGKKYNENTKRSLVELEKKYKSLAAEDSIGFISLLHTVSPQNYVDGLHPDIKGQKEIAAAVWKGMGKLFR